MKSQSNLLVIVLLSVAMLGSVSGFVAGTLCQTWPISAMLLSTAGIALPLLGGLGFLHYREHKENTAATARPNEADAALASTSTAGEREPSVGPPFGADRAAATR